MKKEIFKKFLFLLLMLPVGAAAQIRFGYVNYTEICQQMPQYEQAKQQMASLKEKYEQEAERGENEFQRKFSDFLQGQKDFPTIILQKRQAELQDVLERGIAFRKEAQELLSKAEKDLMNDVYNHLNAAIAVVGQEHGYAFVLNIDGNSAPYINPQMGDDVTDLVRVKLGILKELPNAPQTVEETASESDVVVAPVETETEEADPAEEGDSAQ